MNPFPAEVLPQPLRMFAREGASALGCDLAYVAVPLLPVLASAIGNTRRIRLKAGWSEPAIVWAWICALSGTIKSPALELVLYELWRRQRALLKEHAQARAEYDAAVEEWKATPKKDRIGEKPQAPPPCAHLLTSDITIEALADRLLVTRRGMLVAPDEGGSWINSFNQYKTSGSDLSHWLALHGGRSLKVDRKHGDRPTIYVPNASVCVVGTIQPGALRRALTPELFDCGLTARLLVAMPPTQPKRWSEHEISPATHQAIADLFSGLFALQQAPGVDGDDEPVMVDLTPDAKEMWIDHVNEHGQEMDGMEGAERAAFSKLEAYAARFALLFHCVRYVTGEKTTDLVDALDIANGIGLAKWFGEETLRVYRVLSGTEEENQRRELIELVYRLGGRVTPRQIKEHCRRYANSDEAWAALNALADESIGSWEKVRTGEKGRPPIYFCLADSPDYPARRNGNHSGDSHSVEMAVAFGTNISHPLPPFRVPVNAKTPGNMQLAESGTPENGNGRLA